MKRLFITLLALGLGLQMQAQTSAKETAPASSETTSTETITTSKAEKMKKLNLSEEQRMKMIEINNVNRRAKTAIEADNNLNAEQKQQKLMELRKAQTEKLKSILTTEQFEQLKAMRKEEE